MACAVFNDFQTQLYDRIRLATEPFESVMTNIFADFQDQPSLFSDMLYLLANIRTSNAQAQKYFKRVDSHRRYLENLMGHDVDLRVAIMDYFVHIQPKYLNPKIVELTDFEESLSRSAIDSLTGLFNRAWFAEQSQAELARSQRYKYQFALVFIDIDHFKRINDGYGHQAGDQVLRAMGEYLRRHLRSEDQAYRYGGEEFVLLLPQTDAFGIQRMMERLAADRFSLCRESNLELSFSAGTALFPADGTSIDELIAAADMRMYKAKMEGRSRICSAESSILIQ